VPGPPNTDEGSVTIALSAQDKWKFTPRDRLVYSHRLDDQEWSPFSDLSEVYFSDLSAGKHVFQARAMDRNFNIEPEPSRFEFNVVMPWYREPRLVIIVLLGGAAVIFFAGLAFNRHLRLMRSHAEVERKVAERTRELEAASHALAQSQKMMALGTLAAGVAHDFNSILSIIKGSAQIIEDNMQNPIKIRIRVDRIKTVVEQGAGLVKAMLGYSRSDAEGEVIPDLNHLVNSAVKLLVDRFTTEGWITFEPGPAVFPVNGSADLIQQILVNFVLNAADATTGHPRVVIRTRLWKGAPGEVLAVIPEPAPAYVILEVQDWGCGVPPEILPRIFEPFFTTKAFSTRRGTGLGLSMVYEMARKMGAGLAVVSVVNQGSTFSVILPSNEVSEKSAHPIQAQTKIDLPRLNKANQPK
jgi:signal transduction histidine kinase